MTALERLPRPDECPDHTDWDSLSATTQHLLMGRLTQLGRIDITDEDVLFNARIIAGARRAS